MQIYLKALFWIQFLNATKKSDLMVNIDKSSFSRLMKIEYSWIYKGDTKTIRNLRFSSTVSMISAIIFCGSILSWWTTGSINSAIFSEYVKSLKEFIINKLKIKFNKDLIIIDNPNNTNLNI